MKIGIIGAGAFGSALAVAYGQKGLEVALWARGEPHARDYPDGVFHIHDLADLQGAAAILLVVPAQQTAAFLKENKLPAAPLVLCAKGIDAATGKLQSALAIQYTDAPVSVLTGPGFAGEIAAGLPTALTLAGGNAAQQALLSTPRLRLYRTDDLIGAQAGGALKNVIALACGMAIGAGLGESARAALLTRGFAEMQRLGVALGGKAETFQGLSGLGDLALTCASTQSRNFAQGLAFGQGNGQTGGTVEGLATAKAAANLAAKLGVDAPITAAVADVVSGKATVESAMQSLLSRPLKEE
ncbi:MAG: NAD(P)H-dependent glycerol-3-phosphate dehydrogenase [Rhodobacteraceae bacterium]|nr:NAD(P)H-dependent glycerol-3-phosphate dehydrogenase [Paracoccaceae bacterium]